MMAAMSFDEIGIVPYTQRASRIDSIAYQTFNASDGYERCSRLL
jgi:hypothetical protein